jgi:hypothetical protein
MRNLELLFLEADSGPAVAHVCVGSSHKQGYNIENEPHLLTAQCMGISEFDFEVDRLKSELEDVRREAHQKFTGRVRAKGSG